MLTLSLVLLLVAPLLSALSDRKAYLSSTLHGFVFISMGALVLVEIVPGLVHLGGVWILLFLALGLMLPTLTERVFHHTEEVHLSAIALGLIGLFFHAMADGAAIAVDDHAHHDTLSLAVILHRLPMGLFIWWFIKPLFGWKTAAGALALIGVGTLTGFSQAEFLLQSFQSTELAFFKAFVVGSLFHVVLHQPHESHDVAEKQYSENWAEGIGNLLGLSAVFYIFSEHEHVQDVPWIGEASQIFVQLTIFAAPFLVVALFAMGLSRAFLSGSSGLVARQISTGAPAEHRNERYGKRLADGIRISCGDLLDQAGPWALLALIVTAALYPLSAFPAFHNWPLGLDVIALVLLAVPVCIWVRGMVPLLAVILIGTVSPGAALAFILTAQSVQLLFPSRRLAVGWNPYLLVGGLILLGGLLGISVNLLIEDYLAGLLVSQTLNAGLVEQASVVVLCSLYVVSILRRGARAFLLQLLPHSHHHGSASPHHH